MKEVRDSGRANMMDASRVQVVANEMGLYGLVAELGDRPSRGYVELITEFGEWLRENGE